jgi:adenylate kinase
LPNIDDITKETLVQRSDDQEATIRERLKVYYQRTKPLVSTVTSPSSTQLII